MAGPWRRSSRVIRAIKPTVSSSRTACCGRPSAPLSPPAIRGRRWTASKRSPSGRWRGRRAAKGGLRVISIHGDPVMSELRNAGVEVEEVPGIESALALVVRAEGRVVLVTFTSAAMYLAQNSGVPASLLHAFTIGYSDFFLAIARSRPGAAELTDRFNRVLEFAAPGRDGGCHPCRYWRDRRPPWTGPVSGTNPRRYSDKLQRTASASVPSDRTPAGRSASQCYKWGR